MEYSTPHPATRTAWCVGPVSLRTFALDWFAARAGADGPLVAHDHDNFDDNSKDIEASALQEAHRKRLILLWKIGDGGGIERTRGDPWEI